MTYNELVGLLQNAGNSTRCNELKTWLEATGFTVRDGKRGNHKIFTHDGLKDAGFYSSDYDCGHGRNPTIKKPYLTKILNHVVRKYEMDLRRFLGEEL